MSPIDYTYDETTRPFFERAYAILVEHAGAPDGPHDRESFVINFTRREYPTTEYRCCGAFGFGGKFWRNDGRFYVTCYPEDRSARINRSIDHVNELLAALLAEHKALFAGSSW